MIHAREQNSNARWMTPSLVTRQWARRATHSLFRRDRDHEVDRVSLYRSPRFQPAASQNSGSFFSEIGWIQSSLSFPRLSISRVMPRAYHERSMLNGLGIFLKHILRAKCRLYIMRTWSVYTVHHSAMKEENRSVGKQRNHSQPYRTPHPSEFAAYAPL